MRFKSIVACAAIAPILAAAAEPLRLQPTSAWVVDYAADNCRMVRTFGDGKDKTVLDFESEAPGQMDMLVVGKSLYHASTDGEEVPARFLPVGGKPFGGRKAVSATSNAPAILWAKVPLLPDALADRLEKEEKAASRSSKSGMRPAAMEAGERELLEAARNDFAEHANELQIGANKSVILETGPLGAAMKAFDQCTRDSLRDWGVDPDLEKKIVRPVWAPHPDYWFSPQDYPPDMIRTGNESEVEVRLLVDAAGRPTKCTSISHFQAPEFNKITCEKFMKRAHFAPAELADGTKVPSYYIQRVVFAIARPGSF